MDEGTPGSEREAPPRWRVAMRWHDLLFAHWSVPADAIRPLLPAGVALDTFDGNAWIGVIPFLMTDVRLRPQPPALALRVPEINVRTYVTAGDVSGVWFFSLDADSRLVVSAARRWYGLPYHRSRIRIDGTDEIVHYDARRYAPPATPPTAFQATYRPTSHPAHTSPGTLEHWLTARFHLIAADRRGRLRAARIHHPPWQLQSATAEIRTNTMTGPLGISIEGDPLLHFSRELQVYAEAPQPVVQ